MANVADGAPTSGGNFIEELKAFLKFTGKAWILLFGFITSFPLLNLLLQAIPLEKAVSVEKIGVTTFGNGLKYLSPESVAVTAFLLILFSIWRLIANRHAFITENRNQDRESLNNNAYLIALYGIIFYITYYIFYTTQEANFVLDLIILFLYSCIFYCISIAVIEFAMIEYYDVGCK